MQHIIIGYVERLHDRDAGGHISIAEAVKLQLASLSKPALLKLREAALDLNRIVELELGAPRFDEDFDGHIAAAERALGVE